ncbi:MAG: WecB/TagA/CpsF family glycosyltransferase [bacterium]|nr:WecB/TagA/CpsF family glycosyltransferase [bacterium]
MNSKKTNILSVAVSVTTYEQVLKSLRIWIKQKKRAYICVAATHLIMECQNSKSLLAGVNAADIVTADGMPLVWIEKLYGHKGATRVYGPTLTQKICALATKEKYKVFFLGGKTGQGFRLKQNLIKKYPELLIAGIHETPVRPLSKQENKKILTQIKSAEAQIVFVGLGCPLQENWMVEHAKKLPGVVLVGVGAAFNFISGDVAQAPLFIQNSGLEWLFRIVQEPRLIKRYTIFNTLFVLAVTKQLLTDLYKKL